MIWDIGLGITYFIIFLLGWKMGRKFQQRYRNIYFKTVIGYMFDTRRYHNKLFVPDDWDFWNRQAAIKQKTDYNYRRLKKIEQLVGDLHAEYVKPEEGKDGKIH